MGEPKDYAMIAEIITDNLRAAEYMRLELEKALRTAERRLGDIQVRELAVEVLDYGQS